MFVLRMLPEDLGLYFAFDETRIFVPIFVHSKRDCDVRCLTKRSMLSSIMAFTGVMYAIAREGAGRCSQPTNCNKHRRRWVIRRNTLQRPKLSVITIQSQQDSVLTANYKRLRLGLNIINRSTLIVHASGCCSRALPGSGFQTFSFRPALKLRPEFHWQGFELSHANHKSCQEPCDGIAASGALICIRSPLDADNGQYMNELGDKKVEIIKVESKAANSATVLPGRLRQRMVATAICTCFDALTQIHAHSSVLVFCALRLYQTFTLASSAASREFPEFEYSHG